MNGEWGRGRGVETECIQWDVDRVVSGENGDEMNGDVQWFVCLDRDGESEIEEGEGVEQRGWESEGLGGWALCCEVILQFTDVA